MAPRKTASSSAKKAAAALAGPKKAHKKTKTAHKKKPSRVAAHAHAATVSHRTPHHQSSRYHTYTDHRSESYKHYASIMKTIILFLGFVLLLAILANIFAPSVSNRAITRTSSQNFLDTRESNYKGQVSSHPYKYAVPEGAQTSSGSAPASGSPDAKK